MRGAESPLEVAAFSANAVPGNVHDAGIGWLRSNRCDDGQIPCARGTLPVRIATRTARTGCARSWTAPVRDCSTTPCGSSTSRIARRWLHHGHPPASRRAVPAEPLTSGQCPFPCLDSCYGSLSPLPKWGRVPWNSPVNAKNLGAPEESRNTSPRVAVN